MPSACNGIIRLDKNLEFCKINCKWGYVKQGRPALNKEKNDIKKLTKRNRIKDPKVVCITLEKDHVEFIKRQALLLTQQTGEFVETNDLIRLALQKAFPAPKICDMFGNIK